MKIKLKDKLGTGFESFKISSISLILALICGGVVIIFSGYSPFSIYKAVFFETLSTPKGIALALSQATPLMLSGLAFAIAFKVNLLNLGLEGQLYMGAMASALAGAYITFLPPVLHVIVCIGVGILAGGLVGLFTGFLKIRFGAREVIVSIMLNEIIILFTSYLSNGPFKATSSIFAQTEKIQPTAELTRLYMNSHLTIAIFLAMIIAVILQFLLKKTRLGYEMQVVGFNLRASQTAGININKIYYFTIFLSGAIAGMGGAVMILGVNRRFIEGFSNGLGWSGISVAALAAYNPLAVIVSSLVFGVLKAGAMTVNRTTNIPWEFVLVIQALVVAFVAAPKMIKAILSIFKIKKKDEIKDNEVS